MAIKKQGRTIRKAFRKNQFFFGVFMCQFGEHRSVKSCKAAMQREAKARVAPHKVCPFVVTLNVILIKLNDRPKCFFL